MVLPSHTVHHVVSPQNFIFKSISIWPDSNSPGFPSNPRALVKPERVLSETPFWVTPCSPPLARSYIFLLTYSLSHSRSFLLLCFLVQSLFLKVCLASLCNPHLYFISLKISKRKEECYNLCPWDKDKGSEGERWIQRDGEELKAAAKDSCIEKLIPPVTDSLSLLRIEASSSCSIPLVSYHLVLLLQLKDPQLPTHNSASSNVTEGHPLIYVLICETSSTSFQALWAIAC